MDLIPLAAIGPEHMALMIPLLGISAGIIAIIAGHFQTMEKIRLKARGELSDAVRAELTALRNEVATLRETSTKFDISFDGALSSLEDRMDRTEQRQAVSSYTTEEARATLRQG